LLNAITWSKAYDAAARLEEKHPQKVLTIRFEDFLIDQETVLRQICRFFGIEFLPAMLDVSRSQEARKISSRSTLWESNATAPIAANADKFRKSLSADELELIETVAGKHMERHGYEKITKGEAKITPQKIAAARQRSEKNKKLAWQTLKSTDYKDYTLRVFRSEYLAMIKDRLHKDKRNSKTGATARAAHHGALR